MGRFLTTNFNPRFKLKCVKVGNFNGSLSKSGNLSIFHYLVPECNR